MHIKSRHLFVPTIFNLLVTLGTPLLSNAFFGLHLGMFVERIIFGTFAMIGILSIVAGMAGTVFFDKRSETSGEFVAASICLMVSGIVPSCLFAILPLLYT